MESTANLQLPYIMPSQAQKHVTHNEALAMLDAVVQLSIRDRDLDEPPEDPQEGDRYIVAADATGPWTGWDGAVALRMDGGWRRIDPRTGWLAWVEDEETLVRWTGAAWFDLGAALTDSNNLALLGVGTAADAENPFAAKLNKALWTALYDGEGGDGDLRYTLNKESPAGVLSLLMQSNWSGRAEIGLIGDDDLAIKVSPDGSSWKEVVRVDQTTGTASFPHTAALNAQAGLTGADGAFVRFTAADAAVMQAIVGTVSQTGGVPTGALFEYGNNANGELWRFAGGLQLAWHRISSGSMSGINRINGTWTYPAAFVGNTRIATAFRSNSAGSADPSGQAFIIPTSNPGGTSVDYAFINHTQANNFLEGHLVAVGRWHA